MAVYDLINGHQVQCFKNSLIDYKNGDAVPLKTKTYSYDDTIVIIDTLNPVKKPFEKMVHLIKDSKDEELENNQDIKSIKVKLESSDIEFYNCTRVRLDKNISESDIIVLKSILDFISN